MDSHGKDAHLEPGYKLDKHGQPKKKFGTKVKDFFKSKKRVEKERHEREGHLHHDEHPVEDVKVKDKVKDDGTHKIEEKRKIENSPVHKANKIDETHKVEKEIKPDGTEKVKEKHDVDNGARGAGNKVDEHHSFTAKQEGDGDRKIDETHKVNHHDNGGKLHESHQVKDDVNRSGQHHIDETHKVHGDNVPRHTDREHYTTGPGASSGLEHQGQVGGPHMLGLHEGGAPQHAGDRMLVQEHLSEQRPIQYTNSQAHGIHAGQQVPVAGTHHIAGLEHPQPGHMLPQQGLYQPQQFSTLPPQQGLYQPHEFSTIPPQQGLHGQGVMTHNLGDFIKAGGPKAAAAALQQSIHQMNAPMVQSGQIPQPGAFIGHNALHEITHARQTNLAAQDSTLHMQGGHMPAPQFNLGTNQAGLANLQRNVNQDTQPIVGHPSHMKDGDLLQRPLDAPPTTVFRGTGPAFDPNQAPMTEKEQRLQKAHGQEIKKEVVHEEKNVGAADLKVKETEKIVQKADHVPSGTATKHAPAEETKEVQYMGKTPGHVDTPKDRK